MNRDSESSSSGGEVEFCPPKIPDHELLRKIDRGSYGEVWLARSVTGIYRAVKVVYRSRFSEDRPFVREFEGIQRFEPISREYESLVDILHVGRNERDGYFYYVMELADDKRSGQQIAPEQYEPKTLRSELRQRSPLPFAVCLRIGEALTTALEDLHGCDLVHRDIKPSNIIFVHGQPKLADAGLVVEAGEGRSFVGTEGYVAPEGPGKPQADIYALGMVLYEMLTGFEAKKYPKVPDEWATAPDAKEAKELNQVVLRACEGDLKRRYQCAEEMRADLEVLKSNKSLLRLRRLENLNRVLLLTVGGLVGAVLLGGLVAGFFVFKNRAAEENRRGELREIQVSRLRFRSEGWFSNYWVRVERAAAIRKDQEVLGQASALLAGLDARPVTVFPGVASASAAFASDGRVLIGGVGNRPALLIDTNGVASELRVRGTGPVCWTPDGTPLQLVAVSNALVLREAIDGKVRREFRLGGANPSVLSSNPVLAIATDGSLVAVSLRDRLVVWSTETGASLAEVRTEATSLAFSPDGSLLGTGGMDGTTRVFTLPGLAEVAVLPPALRGNPILCLTFTRDRVARYGEEGRTNSWLLATGDKGAGIVIWDLTRRQPRSFCRGSTWIVTAIAFAPDGLTLASAGRNQPQLWDVTTGQALLRLSHPSAGESLALAFDMNGRRLVCGGLAGAGQATTALWELEPHRGIHALRGLASAARKVWFSENGERVAALSDDWHLGVWEVRADRLLYVFETPVGVLADNAAGCFDVSGERFAFATGREACLYDLATSKVLQRWPLNDGLSDQMQFDSRGRLLLLRREVASEQRNNIWRLHELGGSESPLLMHEQSETNWAALEMAFQASGERFLVWNGGTKGQARVIRAYETVSGRELWKCVTEGTESDLRMCLDPTGSWFGYTTYARDSRLRLVRFSDFRDLGETAEGYQAISPSGHEFGGDGQFFLDRTGKHVVPLVMDWQSLAWVSTFSPNGKLLAWGTVEGVVLVADIQEVLRRLSGLRH